MGRVLRFVGGLLVGATAGAGLVLLFTPRSGADTQQLVQERFQEILAEGRQAAEARRVELTTQLQALKQPGSQAHEL